MRRLIVEEEESKGRETYSLPPDAMVIEAVSVMAENTAGSVLVKDGDELVGIFSERDALMKLGTECQSLSTTRTRSRASAGRTSLAKSLWVSHHAVVFCS